MNTLEELLATYSTYNSIILIIGQHEIMIDLDKQGSYTIIKAFKHEKFSYIGSRSGSLLLKH